MMSSTTPSATTTTPNKWKSQHINDGLTKYGGTRDILGYAEKPPSPKWPNGAKLALNFVINYEEGGEKCILHGDSGSESLLCDIVGAQSLGNYILCITCFFAFSLFFVGFDSVGSKTTKEILFVCFAYILLVLFTRQ